MQVDGEGGVVVPAQQRRPGRLPREAVAAAGANRVPELVQVQAGFLGWSAVKQGGEGVELVP